MFRKFDPKLSSFQTSRSKPRSARPAVPSASVAKRATVRAYRFQPSSVSRKSAPAGSPNGRYLSVAIGTLAPAGIAFGSGFESVTPCPSTRVTSASAAQ